MGPIISATQQTSTNWHSEGLFMGMHWAWWIVWIATLVALAWAFWRLYIDRLEAKREAHDQLGAEEILRDRFARGEIDEEALLRGMSALQTTIALQEEKRGE